MESVQFREDAVEGGTGAAGGCEGEPGRGARFGKQRGSGFLVVGGLDAEERLC